MGVYYGAGLLAFLLTVIIGCSGGGGGSSSSKSFYDSGKIMFYGQTPEYGAESWVSDGTEQGTRMLKDIASISGSSPGDFVSLNGDIYFAASDRTNGRELWKISGGVASLVKDIYPGSSSSNPRGLVAYNGLVYFSANVGSSESQIWVSDGTPSGTVMLKDDTFFSPQDEITHPTEFDGHLYFLMDRGLWKTDGTEAGTVVVANFASGPMAVSGGLLFFRSGSGGQGFELWATDGTSQSIVKDINPGSGDSLPYHNSFQLYNGMIYFIADDGSHGYELWRSDGTDAGTVMIADIRPGQESAFENTTGFWLAAVNNQLLFFANDGVNGRELWKSNGTQAGTVLVKDINEGPYNASSYNGGYATLNNELYFPAFGYTGGVASGQEL